MQDWDSAKRRLVTYSGGMISDTLLRKDDETKSDTKMIFERMQIDGDDSLSMIRGVIFELFLKGLASMREGFEQNNCEKPAAERIKELQEKHKNVNLELGEQEDEPPIEDSRSNVDRIAAKFMN